MTALSFPPARRLWHRALNLLLPPLCLGCDNPVAQTDTLCAPCWRAIQFIAPPFCACCGTPLDADLLHDGSAETADVLCASCVTTTPAFQSVRAAMLYDDASKNLVLGFKHGDRTYLAKALSRWMAQAGGECLTAADFIIPVPLHRWRLFARRYNQAALLAHLVGRHSGRRVLIDALRRARATPPQGHMNRTQRQDNIKGAFAVPPRYVCLLSGKTVILIDDVLTTGATVNECAKTVLAAGAKTVHVLTLARVKTSV